MTDKQIIIDGVNVTECVHRATNRLGNDIGTYCRCFTGSCFDIHDCHYKNWKRKEQECEALGQAYLETNELLQEKTKECTNLKAELDCDERIIDQLEADLSDQEAETLKAKEQGCERLSSLIRETQIYLDVCNNCKDDILLYPSISGKTNYTQIEVEERSLKKIIQQLDQLKTKHQKAKKIIKEAINDFSLEVGTPYYDKLITNAKEIGIKNDD